MRYIALLRGVFPKNTPNSKLIPVFESLGFEDIKTLGSSGNVFFTTDEKNIQQLETKIEAALQPLLGEKALALVKNSEQLSSLITKNPFNNYEHTRESYLTVTFLKDKPAKLTDSRIIYYDQESNALCTVNDATLKPSFMSVIEKQYGKENTTRTWGVVSKINALLS